MNEHFVNILIENINRIKNSPTESVHKSGFKYVENTNFSLDDLIDFLVVNDYIETDRNDAFYFLTHETYDLIEGSELEDSIKLKFDLEEDEIYEELSDEEIKKITEDNKKQKREHKISYYAILFILGATMTWVLYNRKSNKESELPNIELDTIINEFKNRNHNN